MDIMDIVNVMMSKNELIKDGDTLEQVADYLGVNEVKCIKEDEDYMYVDMYADDIDTLRDWSDEEIQEALDAIASEDY